MNNSKTSTDVFGTVGVIGCGWFGLPLAKELLACGYKVNGTKTTGSGVEQLELAGINGYLLDLETDIEKITQNNAKLNKELNSLFDADILLVNIPPKLRNINENILKGSAGNNPYLLRLQKLKTLISHRQYKKFIFISTTGVYPDPGIFAEEEISPWSEKSKILLMAESLFNQKNTSVVRFAGLIGDKRHPARFLSGKKNLAGGDLPVNLVHLDDCIQGIISIIKSESAGGIYNLVTPHHPFKKDFYTQASLKMGLTPPEFIEMKSIQNGKMSMGKTVTGSRITKDCGFEYKYQNLYDAL